MAKKKIDILAKMSRHQDVTFKVPLKFAVLLIALAKGNELAKPYHQNLLDMQRQIAKQLKTGTEDPHGA